MDTTTTRSDAQSTKLTPLLDAPSRAYLKKFIAAQTPATTYYMGQVVSNAAGTPFPAGWSVAHPGSGHYVITHTLGSTPYVVQATCKSGGTEIQVTSFGSTTFTVFNWLTSSAPGDGDFTFVVFT